MSPPRFAALGVVFVSPSHLFRVSVFHLYKKRTNYFTNKVTTLQVVAVEFLHDLGDLDKEALVLDLKRLDGAANLHEPRAD